MSAESMDTGDAAVGPYGGCEGPKAMYVKLISSDGHEFVVKREHALISGTIKAMLSGPGQFSENETNEVNFREIPSHVLQKVCQYFSYKLRYTNSTTEIPEFIIARPGDEPARFDLQPIPPEVELFCEVLDAETGDPIESFRYQVAFPEAMAMEEKDGQNGSFVTRCRSILEGGALHAAARPPRGESCAGEYSTA